VKDTSTLVVLVSVARITERVAVNDPATVDAIFRNEGIPLPLNEGVITDEQPGVKRHP
jgi:hypothetical protein